MLLHLVPQFQALVFGQKCSQFNLAPVAGEGQVIRHGAAVLVQGDPHPVWIGLPVLSPPVRAVADEGQAVGGEGQILDDFAAGKSPKAYVDEMVAPFQSLDAALGISFDRFIRTTDEDHKALVQALWQRMAANGDLYLGRYEGWYSVRDEAYYDE